MSDILEKQRVLPTGFEDLLPFVDRWAVDDTAARIKLRAEASMEDIQAFYDAMVGRADEAMSLIDTHSLHALPDDVGRLCRLVLALAQAAMAVEIHGQPRAPGTPYPNSIRLVRGTPPFG